jgi:hypothetical protein
MEMKEKLELIDLIKSDISTIAKKEAEGAKSEVAELHKSLESKINASLDGFVTKEAFDKAENDLRKAMTAFEAGQAKDVSFSASLAEGITKSMDDLTSMRSGRSKSAEIYLQKDPGIMTATASITGSNTAAGRFAINNNETIVPIARRQTYIRQIIGMGATDQEVYPYLCETPKEGVFGVQNPEGSAKPQVEYKAELKTAVESTIAAWQKIGRQTLTNVRGLSSFIQMVMVADLLIKEDDELLNGTGSNGRVQGFLQSASAPTAFGLTIPSPQIYDVIAGSAAKLAGLNYTANFALVNPVDYWRMVTLKDQENAYLQNIIYNASSSSLNVFGIPVFPTTAITAGNFVVGDSRYVMPMQREGISLRFFDQDDKNVQENLITARIEERILQAVYRTDAFIGGSIATAVTNLTPST